jgi:phage terminase large subunit-like protein
MIQETEQRHNLLPTDVFASMCADRKVRKAIVTGNHALFFHFYFNDYVRYETAEFQKELFTLSQDTTVKNLAVMAFRDSAKSTILTFSFPIWAVLGAPQKKFVLIVSQTRNQARQHLLNIKRELEGNSLLRSDLGPFETQDDEWGSYALVLPQYEAKIMAISTEQSVRGLRHGAHRPDLIIVDDIEDSASVKTKEGRDKTFNWVTGDLLPAAAVDAKIVFLGNLLHQDSVLMRIKKLMAEKKFSGVFKEYPLVTIEGKILWLGKFPSQESIEALRATVLSESAWQREYLLILVPDEDQVIQWGWINYYNKAPEQTSENDYKYTWTGVDLAISLKDTADYTAMVSARIFGYGEELRIYVLPNPTNKRMDFPEQVESMKSLSLLLGEGSKSRIFVEDVAYQAALPQQLQALGFPVDPVHVRGDKRERLVLTSYPIKQAKILFPHRGCEHLLAQLVGFGVEKYDDLADAFSLLIHKILEENKSKPATPEIFVL